MVSRRAFVTGLAAVPLAGCGQADPTANTTQSTEVTATEAPETDEVSLEPRGPVRGESDVDVSVHEIRGEDRVEFRADGSTYFVPDWEYVAADTAWVASIAAWRYVTMELDVDPMALGVSTGDVRQEGEASIPIISTGVNLDRNGNIQKRPVVSFAELVSITPRSVRVMYYSGGSENLETVPIYARYRIYQPL